jgi:myo-inositol-1(or 4)-monophosphatase
VMKTSSTTQLRSALLATGFPYDVAMSDNNNNLDHFGALTKASRGVRRPGAAALDLAYVAAGRLDGFWELKLSPWDVAAGALIVAEAGGKVCDFSGNHLDFAERRIHIVATNGQESLQQSLLEVLSPGSQALIAATHSL